MWEYLVEWFYPGTDGSLGQVKALDKIGEDGWELVQVVAVDANTQAFYFKRPLSEQTLKWRKSRKLDNYEEP